jgi:hypothetical protein
MRMIGCREMLAEFGVDPSVARAQVPHAYALRARRDGAANLLVLVQECRKCVLDGMVHIRPLRLVHIWIELDGPDETGPPLAGTSGSLATTHWYALPHQTDDRLARVAFGLAGIDIQLVRSISLIGDRDGIREGAVEERSDPAAHYAWTTTGSRWPTPRLVTGRRWFYREYGHLVRRRSVGLVVCRARFLGEGTITLEAGTESTLGRLGFGTTLHGSANAVEIDCSVRFLVRRRAPGTLPPLSGRHAGG